MVPNNHRPGGSSVSHIPLRKVSDRDVYRREGLRRVSYSQRIVETDGCLEGDYEE